MHYILCYPIDKTTISSIIAPARESHRFMFQGGKPMKIIKRNGAEVVFDIEKIINAVTKANEAVEEKVRMTPLQIERITESVRISCE